jgi:hypothetical protein
LEWITKRVVYKMKKIKFIPQVKNAELVGIPPQPSNKFIPDWYKGIHPFTNNATKISMPMGEQGPNITIKRCVPFLDAMTAGYMAVTDDDINIEYSNGGPLMRWRSDGEMITFHSPEQYNGLPIPDGYAYMVAKWHNEWGIELPDGFSALFTHPSNRLDLPFYTLTGLVDCDKYNLPVHFPFILKKEFEGVIPSGTPVAQIIPIKRESWSSDIEKYNEEKSYIKRRTFFRTFSASYKKNYWTKKSYE